MSARQKIAIYLLVIMGLLPFALQSQVHSASPQSFSEQAISEHFQLDQLNQSDTDKAAELANAISASPSALEWLGPLAPIAISPFFGIACLCGLSQYGDSLPFDLPFNEFISNNPVLQNPGVLWIFVGLTVLTSLPRLTKVSKPLAQAIDQIEAWAGIITILVIRFGPSLFPENGGGSVDPTVAEAIVPGATIAGFTLPLDILMGIAAIINIFVINTIKFLFEVMVWLIPFPSVDAMLEAANKATCAGLIAIYAFSPLLATVLNLLIFAACLVAYRWAHRRVVYMRAVVFDPIWGLIRPGYGKAKAGELAIFSNAPFASFPTRTKLNLKKEEAGWSLVQHKWFRRPAKITLSEADCNLKIEKGLFVNKLIIDGPDGGGKFHFTRRFSGDLDTLAGLLGANFAATQKPAEPTTVSGMSI